MDSIYLQDNTDGFDGSALKEKPVLAVVANPEGEIFELPGFQAVGMEGKTLTPLLKKNTVPIPHGGELMFLPGRKPVVYDMKQKKIITLSNNPFMPSETVYPVAAFNSPGYVQGYMAAYEERKNAPHLPLFSYGAVGWCEDGFYTTAILVDPENRQDLRLMSRSKVVAGVKAMKTKIPNNKLRLHLEKCALTYGCPAAKNFFIGRFEAPLPTSKACNARCLGCLSLQKHAEIKSPQERIMFTPSPDDIAELALYHIGRVKNAIVSFGQGCEGEPLMAAEAIIPAVRKIRKETDKGTINFNTNGSMPEVIGELADAGIDSIRVSINSLQEIPYETYFRPMNYRFSDVISGIDTAISKKIFVSINYLNSPGFTDSKDEVTAFTSFLENHPIHFIQWRNLNYDPLRYWDIMGKIKELKTPMGMADLMKHIRNAYPGVGFGYFNPPKENFPFISRNYRELNGLSID